MIKYPYEKFKELFELQRKESNLVGKALLADAEGEGKGDSIWAQAQVLNKDWKKRKDDCYNEKEEGWSATCSVMSLLEDFSYLGEEQLIKMLLVANIEVVHAEN